MEQKSDGYSYFIDYGREDDERKIATEYRFIRLGNGDVDAYSRDVSNNLITNEFEKLHTMIKPDGNPNLILNSFIHTLNNHLNASLSRRTSSTPGRRPSTMAKRSIFSLSLDNELKSIMIDNGMCIADFTNAAIEEKLKKEGIL